MSKININIKEANSVIIYVVYVREGDKNQDYFLTPVVFTIKQNESGEIIITIPIKKRFQQFIYQLRAANIVTK